MEIELALNWWNNILNDWERAQFPNPKDNEDILSYYRNPEEYISHQSHEILFF